MSAQWSGNWKITALVLERSQAKGATLLVALAIAHLANRRDDDWTTASLRTLAAWSTCDKQTVLNAIPALEALGELEVKRGGDSGPNDARQNRYRIEAAALKRLPRRPAQGGRIARPPGGRVVRPPFDGGGRVGRPQVVASVDHGGRVGRPQVVESARSNARTRVNQSPTEIQSDSPGGESTGAGAPVAVVTSDQSVGSPGDLFSDPKGRTPLETPGLPAANGVVANEVTAGREDLEEMARVALSRLAGGTLLRPTLAELGWDESNYPRVTTWLAIQDHAKLREIIFKAHDALDQTAKKRRAGGH